MAAYNILRGVIRLTCRGLRRCTDMAKASRAIIIENGNILVMHRNKQGDQYYTLVGGRVEEYESVEAAVAREVMEETGLQVLSAQLVFYEPHTAPYNEQYIFLCQVAPHGNVEIQKASEEAMMNKMGFNTHTPYWVSLQGFPHIPFRTPTLHQAIIAGIKKGFPKQAITI